MALWLENLLMGKASTFNIVIVLLTINLIFNSSVIPMYVIMHVTKFDKDTLDLIEKIGFSGLTNLINTGLLFLMRDKFERKP